MGRVYTRVHRLLRLIAAIHSKRGLVAADLARLCEVHERTVYRDIDTLNASGIPCSFDAESGGYRAGQSHVVFLPLQYSIILRLRQGWRTGIVCHSVCEASR